MDTTRNNYEIHIDLSRDNTIFPKSRIEVEFQNVQDSGLQISFSLPGRGTIANAPANYFLNNLKAMRKVVTLGIDSLLNKIDFLGYQLDFALGNIKKKAFEQICKEHLIPKREYTLDDLKNMIRYLELSLEKTYDADELSLIFNCNMDNLENALNTLNTEVMPWIDVI